MTASNKFTVEQLEIINLTQGQHLVLAPPGTGKTELLSQRVFQALKNDISPDKMLCLTFTNRAAKGMKERIKNIFPSSNLFIGNIHSYCYNFLIKNRLIPLCQSLLDESDSELLMEESISSLNYIGTLKPKELLAINAYQKQLDYDIPPNLLFKPQEYLKVDTIVTDVCKYYETLKKESLLLDFDDLLIYAYKALKSNNNYQFCNYEWLQVDEVQDLNSFQWSIIYLISSGNCHAVYFGDYDQSIYSFMGANISLLSELKSKCNIFSLSKNFRSPKYLLNIFNIYANVNIHSNSIIPIIADKESIAEKNALILMKIQGTCDDESSFIANKIIPSYISDRTVTSILVKSNKQVDHYSSKLLNNGIVHFKVSSFDLFSRKLIKDIIAFLLCLGNIYSRLSWVRLFSIFTKLSTLKASRKFVNSLFSIGLLPVDFLNSHTSSLYLESFLQSYFYSRLIIFDTETTGLNTNDDDIIQIAAIEIINGNIGASFEIYLHTTKSLASSEKIHNISKSFLCQKGVNRKEGLLKFNNFINGSSLLAHNLPFDYSILFSNFKKEGISLSNLQNILSFDSIEISRRLYPKLPSYKLKYLISHFNLEGVNSHNALDDVKATKSLVDKLAYDSIDFIDKQHSFMDNHKDIIKDFSSNLSPLWSYAFLHMDEVMSLSDIISYFVNYISTNFSYKIKEEDKSHLLKLLKHMDIYVGSQPLKTLLTYIPDYVMFKESDLIIGDERVIVSTIHKAKGLEFDNVIIPNCTSNDFPSFYSKTQAAKDEDIRLLYVALTRSKSNLIISFPDRFIADSGSMFPRQYSEFLSCVKDKFRHIVRVNN